jgi:Peptidase family M1 domain
MRRIIAVTGAAAVAACSHAKPSSAPAPAQEAAKPAPAETTHVEPQRLRLRTPAVVDFRTDPFYPLNRMDWPGPNSYRDASGGPGPSYWQQRADYSIRATLDTTAQKVTGEVTATYTNNSPDTLRFVWMQADQNIYNQSSQGNALYAADTRTAAGHFEGGYTFSDVTVNGSRVEPHIDDTMMRLDLPAPLAPRGGKATIAIKFAFKVPEHGSDRMGRDGQLYEIAQWYPRMVVYDDVRGWNVDQYLGQGEFYLEYGDIDYAVTVPAGYTVAGSGVLENPGDVLTTMQRQRLAKAITSRDVVPIITADEAAPKATSGMKTWRFRARNVRDVAWAAAPDFRWDATSVRGVLCQAYYEFPKAGKEWEQAAENTQWTIGTYSELLYPFPYPQATAVAGPVGGMEYPMFVMDGYENPDLPGDVFRTNDHEHGHEWFPMIVGSNERRYAWMDEGINTYINAFSQERRYGNDPTQWPRGMSNFFSFLGDWYGANKQGLDAPLMNRPDHFADQDVLGVEGYQKPGAVLLALRDHVVGPESMDRAMREYVRRWAFKHPTPGDFFRTVENVAGKDLSWFWRSFFYTTDVLDIGIDSVSTKTGADGQLTASISLQRHTSVVFPVELRLALADGSTKDVHLPVDIWSRGMEFTAQVPVHAEVKGARLWPDRSSIPDMNPRNDTWGAPPAADPPHPATRGGLAPQISAR